MIVSVATPEHRRWSALLKHSTMALTNMQKLPSDWKPPSRLECPFKIGPSRPPLKMRTSGGTRTKNWKRWARFLKLHTRVYSNAPAMANQHGDSARARFCWHSCEPVLPTGQTGDVQHLQTRFSKFNLLNTWKNCTAKHSQIFLISLVFFKSKSSCNNASNKLLFWQGTW